MNNIDDFTKGLFPTTYNNIGYNIPDENNNKIINESIIYNKLGNKKALLEFYNHLVTHFCHEFSKFYAVTKKGIFSIIA